MLYNKVDYHFPESKILEAANDLVQREVYFDDDQREFTNSLDKIEEVELITNKLYKLIK